MGKYHPVKVTPKSEHPVSGGRAKQIMKELGKLSEEKTKIIYPESGGHTEGEVWEDIANLGRFHRLSHNKDSRTSQETSKIENLSIVNDEVTKTFQNTDEWLKLEDLLDTATDSSSLNLVDDEKLFSQKCLRNLDCCIHRKCERLRRNRPMEPVVRLFGPALFNDRRPRKRTPKRKLYF